MLVGVSVCSRWYIEWYPTCPALPCPAHHTSWRLRLAAVPAAAAAAAAVRGVALRQIRIDSVVPCRRLAGQVVASWPFGAVHSFRHCPVPRLGYCYIKGQLSSGTTFYRVQHIHVCCLCLLCLRVRHADVPHRPPLDRTGLDRSLQLTTHTLTTPLFSTQHTALVHHCQAVIAQSRLHYPLLHHAPYNLAVQCCLYGLFVCLFGADEYAHSQQPHCHWSSGAW